MPRLKAIRNVWPPIARTFFRRAIFAFWDKPAPKLHRKDPSFCLMSSDTAPTYKIEFLAVKLNVRYLKVEPKLDNVIHHKLASTPAVYSTYNATDIKARHIQPGSRSCAFEKIFAGERIPNRIVFAIVVHEAYVGSYKRNPLNFYHYNIEEITLSVDATTLNYRIDVKNNIYMELFTPLACEMGNKDFSTTPNILYTEGLEGTAMFPFDLAPNHSTEDLQPLKVQNVRVELKFSEPLPEAIQLIAFVDNQKFFKSIRTKSFRLFCEFFHAKWNYVLRVCGKCSTKTKYAC